MRVLMVSDTPFAGLRHRPQQLAIGLAREGHEVLYLAPTSAYRPMYEPDRFASGTPSPDTAPLTRAAEAAPGSSSAPPADTPPALRVRDLPESDDVRQATTLKEAWALWGEVTRREVMRWLVDPVRDGGAGDEVFEADIVYCDHPVLLPPLKGATSLPVVIDCSEDFEAQVASRSAIEAYREALSVALPRADGMIANNRYMIESWDRYLSDEAPRTIIEHGVDLDLFRPTEPARAAGLRRELEIGEGRPMITFLGHVDARISFEDLLSMMEAQPEPVFVFVGQVRPDGLSLLQRLPADRVRPVGAVRPDRAAEIVGAADALILPFRREPHLEAVRGLNLYEYLATGRPIAASFRRALKAYRDVIYLYATQDELQAALRDALAEASSESKARQRLSLAQQAGWTRRVDELARFLATVPGV